MNSQLDGGDIKCVWDFIGITKGTGSTQRIGDECRLTRGVIDFYMRAQTDAAQVANADLYVVLYIFSPKKHVAGALTSTVKDGIAANFLNYNEATSQFMGNSFLNLTQAVNSEEIRLHKKKVFKVHNAVGGVTSWFQHYSYRMKPQTLRFNTSPDVPNNHNLCWAYCLVNANGGISAADILATRLQCNTNLRIWFKQ